MIVADMLLSFIMVRFAYCLLAVMFLVPAALPAAAQEQEMPDLLEIAETEADRLQHLLDLDGGQLFYVDSTLKHDYQAMQEEIMKLQSAKVSNSSMYISVQDKWMEAIDKSYRRIFTEEQWNTYLKNGAAKQQKAREKRKVNNV